MLDQVFQREILASLAETYPAEVSWPDVFGVEDKAVVNINYLTEHKLVESEWHGKNAVGVRPMWVRITARGLDFIQDDGGLSAVLGVVSVRLYDDEFKQLIISRISKTEGDPTVKQRLVDTIKALPSSALNSVANSVFDIGLKNLPTGLAALRDLIEHARS